MPGLIRIAYFSLLMAILPLKGWAMPIEKECCEMFAHKLDDTTLDTMRGGFITSNGMHIDFQLVTRSMVDNAILQETMIDSRALNNIDLNSLRTIVQVGDQNLSSLSAADVLQNPQVLSVIQNTLNDKVIQNLSVLDVNVTNVRNFNIQALVPIIDNQAVSALQ